MRGINQHDIVMIADDDLFVCQLLRSALFNVSKVVEINDGSQVLKAYEQYNPDIIFLDIHLPNHNGLELLPKILQADADAYVVMLSGDSKASNVKDSQTKGSKGFLTKPFEKKRLMRFIHDCPTINYSEST